MQGDQCPYLEFRSTTGTSPPKPIMGGGLGDLHLKHSERFVKFRSLQLPQYLEPSFTALGCFIMLPTPYPMLRNSVSILSARAGNIPSGRLQEEGEEGGGWPTLRNAVPWLP